MTTTAPAVALPSSPDVAQLAPLNALSHADRANIVAAVENLPPGGVQDYLITKHRIAVSLPALTAWLTQARQSQRAENFNAFLASLRADVAQAQEFCRFLDAAVSVERANAFVLSCKLFEALQTGDRAAILDFAQVLAAVLRSEN